MSFNPCNDGPTPNRIWTRSSNNCSYVYNYTEEQLNMRRKAEILKYKKNSSNLTKKQQWSRLNRGYGPNRKKVWATQNQFTTNPNTSNLPRVNNTLICSNSIVNCSSTSSSDVPGPIMNLCFDKNVPLTRYIVRRRYPYGSYL